MSTTEDAPLSVIGKPTCVVTSDRSATAYWIDLDGEPDGLGCQPAVKLWVLHDRGVLRARLSDARVEPVLVAGAVKIRKEVFSLLARGRTREMIAALPRFNRKRFDAFYQIALAWARSEA